MNPTTPQPTDNDPLLQKVLAQLKEVRTSRGRDGTTEHVCWCPFHADGQGNPPHQANLYVSERGFICHACGEKGGLRQLAKRLGIEWERIPPEATYDYCDADAQLLFQAVRYPGKRFCFRRLDGKGGWIYDLKGVQRVLYRLPDILGKGDATVYVVEGEKDADRLAKEGLVATTNPGGAGKWRDEDSQTLKDRDVVILPDNDEPGRKHGLHVANSLFGKARSIKIVELPGLSAKGDVSDWLDAGGTRQPLERLVEAVPAYSPPRGRLDAPRGGTRLSESDQLSNLALERGLDLFHDPRGEPFAAMPEPRGPRVVPLDSEEFISWLGRLGYEEVGHAPSKHVVDTCLRRLGGVARYSGPQRRLDVRCARHEGAIWIDLDGRRAIRVSADGWSVVKDPPILFRWFAQKQALPEPVRGGDLRLVLRHVNVRDPASQVLLLCWLVAAFVPDIPIPVMVFHGPAGSAKTTSHKVIKRLIDPSEAAVRGPLDTAENLAIAASQERFLVLDNLTALRAWLSEALCRTVQGEAWSGRLLYSNYGQRLLTYRCVMGLSGISCVVRQPDLLDRSIIIGLDAISPEHRREERVIWETLEADAGLILGGILDALSRAMALAPTLQLARLPRMADFARQAAAAAEALGIGASVFLRAYQANVDRQNEEAVEESPVAQAVLMVMDNQTSWRGTSTELLDLVERTADDRGLRHGARSWTKSASWFGRLLRVVKPALLAAGVEITEERSGLRRLIRIQRLPENAVTDVTAVTSSPQAPQECLSGDGTVTATNPVPSLSPLPADCVREPYDANDGSDGISADSVAGPDGHAQVWPSEMAEWPEEARIEYSERAGARIADGLGRGEAERRAREDIVAKWGPRPCEPPDASGGASDSQMTGAVDNGDGGSPENPG